MYNIDNKILNLMALNVDVGNEKIAINFFGTLFKLDILPEIVFNILKLFQKLDNFILDDYLPNWEMLYFTKMLKKH